MLEVASGVLETVYLELQKEFLSAEMPLDSLAAFRVSPRVEALFPQQLIITLCEQQMPKSITKADLLPSSVKQITDYGKKFVKLPLTSESLPESAMRASLSALKTLMKSARADHSEHGKSLQAAKS